MGQPDRRIDVLIAKSGQWSAEMTYLRGLLLATELDEAFKWRQAAYTLNGEVVVMIAQRKTSCGLAFFRGALLQDPDGRLVTPGPNSQASRELRFPSLAEIKAATEVIGAYLAEAIALHKEGRKVRFDAKHRLELPPVLTAALDKDAALAQAWDALTPGRKRSWLLHLDSAKQDVTKRARLDKGRAKILAGKGQNER